MDCKSIMEYKFISTIIKNQNTHVYIAQKGFELCTIKRVSKIGYDPNEKNISDIIVKNKDLLGVTVPIKKVTEDANYFYLIMDYFPDSCDLFDYLEIVKKIPLKNFIYQMINIIYLLHKNGILHLDVKLENFLVIDKKQLKILDFGFSVYYSPERLKLGTFVNTYGTSCYNPPESKYQMAYDKSDIWGLGVCFYILLTGKSFMNHEYKKTLYEIRDPLLRDIIDKCLQINPHKRPSAEELLSHEYFNESESTEHTQQQKRVKLEDVVHIG